MLVCAVSAACGVTAAQRPDPCGGGAHGTLGYPGCRPCGTPSIKVQYTQARTQAMHMCSAAGSQGRHSRARNLTFMIALPRRPATNGALRRRLALPTTARALLPFFPTGSSDSTSPTLGLCCCLSRCLCLSVSVCVCLCLCRASPDARARGGDQVTPSPWRSSTRHRRTT